MNEIPGVLTQGPWAVKVSLSEPEIWRDTKRLFSIILIELVANEQRRLYERKINPNDLKNGINIFDSRAFLCIRSYLGLSKLAMKSIQLAELCSP